MPGFRWSLAEVNYLQEISSTDQIDHICRRYNRFAIANGWQKRSLTAITGRLKRLGLSVRPMHNGWSCPALAEILGVRRDRVHDWIEKGFLKSSRSKNKRNHRILERDFIAFAKQFPEWLTRIDKSALLILLEPAIAYSILSQRPAPGVPIPIYSAKTGRRYRSINTASKQENLSRSTIAACALSGAKTRDGDRFIAITKS
jgi:hypothetical protein